MYSKRVFAAVVVFGLVGCVSDFGVSNRDLHNSEGWVLVENGPGVAAATRVMANSHVGAVEPERVKAPEPPQNNKKTNHASKVTPAAHKLPAAVNFASTSPTDFSNNNLSSKSVVNASPASIEVVAKPMVSLPNADSSSQLDSSVKADPSPEVTPFASACHVFYRDFQKSLDAFGLGSGQGHVLPEFPFLRSNRAMAASAVQLSGDDVPAAVLDAAWNRWLERSVELANTAWSQMWRNLPRAQRRRLLQRLQTLAIGSVHSQAQRVAAYHSVDSFPSDCAEAMLRAAFLRAEQSAAGVNGFYQIIGEQAQVASEYRQLQRVLGVYPITQVGPKAGLNAHRRRFHNYFKTPLAQLPITGELRRYRAARSAEKGLAEGAIERDSMRWPDPSESQQAALWERYAPIWEVDTLSEDDQVGQLEWSGEAGTQVAVSTAKPTEYRYLSYQWLAGEWRLQLNYQVWFPARSKSHATDILAGALDSVIWRVTLDDAGEPMVFDSVHACGCYHVVVPMPAWQQRTTSKKWPEPPLLVDAKATLAESAEGRRLLLRLSAQSHYLQGIAWVVGSIDSQPLVVADYDQLWSLPTTHSNQAELLPRRPAFDHRGIIRGSERAERYLLWPMGIVEPGAMRAAGKHAIAFVGERHFDDWNLLESMLRRR